MKHSQYGICQHEERMGMKLKTSYNTTFAMRLIFDVVQISP